MARLAKATTVYRVRRTDRMDNRSLSRLLPSKKRANLSRLNLHPCPAALVPSPTLILGMTAIGLAFLSCLTHCRSPHAAKARRAPLKKLCDTAAALATDFAQEPLVASDLCVCHGREIYLATSSPSPQHAASLRSEQQKRFMDEALLEPAPEDREGAWPSLLTIVGFAFLTFNSAMAVYSSNRDVGTISFVVFSYLDLVLLFYFLRQYERTLPESPRREHIKMVVWLLTTMLTAAFSYKVAAIMPLPVQVLVWAMAGATVLGGFYAFFVHQEKPWQDAPKA
ncbi:uncharacterized protein LOC133923217 [Phragmites australis]|uniref:uncharacterized protein LOC133923217 n=1 Tax=Phragmites australis TaxID=29695 RepID=UPI002D7A0DC7|nr:uncharacterized protein LOC133923217 [Phragmites australis]